LDGVGVLPGVLHTLRMYFPNCRRSKIQFPTLATFVELINKILITSRLIRRAEPAARRLKGRLPHHRKHLRADCLDCCREKEKKRARGHARTHTHTHTHTHKQTHTQGAF